jgi:hypothetical protein
MMTGGDMLRSVHLLLARRERLPGASRRSSWLHCRQVAVAFLACEDVAMDVVDRFKSTGCIADHGAELFGAVTVIGPQTIRLRRVPD